MAGDFVPVAAWFAWENQDCGLAIADIDGDGHLDLLVTMVDDPVGQNTSQYRVGGNVAADIGGPASEMRQSPARPAVAGPK